MERSEIRDSSTPTQPRISLRFIRATDSSRNCYKVRTFSTALPFPEMSSPMLDSPKSSTSLQQSIALARAERVGPHGVAAKEFDAKLKETEAALDWLRAGYADGSLPHLKVPEERGDLASIEAAAKRLRD